MASSITAPITPATMENIHPPLPAPAPMPMRLSSHPPRTAPTIPMMMVTIIPPGSSPGIANLASAPAISPTMIQNSNADSTSTRLLFVGPYISNRIYLFRSRHVREDCNYMDDFGGQEVAGLVAGGGLGA